MNTEIEKLREKIAALRRRTTPLCEGLQEEYGAAQERADAAYRACGHDGSPPHLMGESLIDYRHRLLRGVQDMSATWKKTNLPRDEGLMQAIEPQIYRDAAASITDPSQDRPGVLREVIERDATGRRITKFYGDNSVTWAPFQPRQIAYVTAFGGG